MLRPARDLATTAVVLLTVEIQCSSLLQTLACRAPHRGLCPTDRTPRLLLLDRTLCSVLLGRETAAPHAVGVEVVAEAELDATDEVEEAAEIVLDVEVEVKPSMIARDCLQRLAACARAGCQCTQHPRT